MNNFTREELKLLGRCVFSQFVNSLNDPSIQHLQTDLKSIRDKIEPMIDKYCEHKQYTPILGEVDAYQCDKCNEIIMASN